MNWVVSKWGILPGLLAFALFCAPAALAAQGSDQGDTSGPAAGKNTTPSTAVQKDRSQGTGNVAGGAAGVSGRQGAESGASPRNGATNR